MWFPITADEARAIPPRHAALRDDRAALLLRLFRDGGSIAEVDADRLGIPGNLMLRRGGRVRAAFRLDFIRDLQILSDWPTSEPDAVLASGETTAILYRAAEQWGDVDRVLDLGCGLGTLALLLARQAREVIGTDLNGRAVELSRRNAEAHGIRHARFLRGDLFEPVHGEQFDLIVSQPPFLPKPVVDRAQVFLHGGARGDELARAIVQQVPDYLLPQGRALIFSDWPLRKGERLEERIEARAQRTVYRSPAIPPEHYASNYGFDLASVWAEDRVVAVHQCLTLVEPGEGYREIEVLPHEWTRMHLPE